jgi:hypothetical protein
VFFLVFLALGIVFLAVSTVGVKYVDQYCAKTLDLSGLSDHYRELIKDIRETEEQLARVPTQWMCTTTCPCPAPTPMNNWYELYTKNASLDKYARDVFNRTVKISTNDTNKVPFTFSAGGQTSYGNFWECYLFLKEADEKYS